MKTKNPENRYEFTCKVTGEKIKTNPQQFRETAARYKITLDELDNTYVSREGRKVIASEKLTPEQAMEKYGIHTNVANFLKCLRPAPVRQPRARKVETTEVTTPSPEDLTATGGMIVEASGGGISVSIIAEDEAPETVESEVAETETVNA